MAVCLLQMGRAYGIMLLLTYKGKNELPNVFAHLRKNRKPFDDRDESGDRAEQRSDNGENFAAAAAWFGVNWLFLVFTIKILGK